jgi:hypothetical protein
MGKNVLSIRNIKLCNFLFHTFEITAFDINKLLQINELKKSLQRILLISGFQTFWLAAT